MRSPLPAATTSPTTRDIAWAAGFYEGEGTAQRMKRGGTTTAKVTQVNREPLQRMQELFGGSLREGKCHGFSSKPQFIWYVCGARARGFLYTIFTFLSQKRRAQVRVALGA